MGTPTTEHKSPNSTTRKQETSVPVTSSQHSHEYLLKTQRVFKAALVGSLPDDKLGFALLSYLMGKSRILSTLKKKKPSVAKKFSKVTIFVEPIKIQRIHSLC